MATKAKTGKAKKIAISDVSHPGTTAPSDTSVPIITHRPMVKDPMMVEATEDAEETPSKQPLMKTSELKVEPPKAESTAQDEEPAPEHTKTAAKDTAEKSSEDESAPEESETPEPASDKSEEAGKKPKRPDPDAEDAAAAAAEAKVESMIDSKKYFLPINAVEHRRSRRFVLLGIILAIVLALAWVDVALDAGIIKLGGVKAPIHFISN